MQKRHIDRKQYFKEQGITTEKYVIPYIEDYVVINESTRVLEIGCGEGGNLIPFLERDCRVVGVDLNTKQIENARSFFEESLPNAQWTLLSEDIYKVDLEQLGQFDLIIMRDVIEHIHNQERFLNFIKVLLKPKGRIFFGFPPWRMPFGGHQQICQNKLLSKLPFFHLLNARLYKWVLLAFNESEKTIADLLEIKETGISINRFERILQKEKYIFERKDLFFINPNYEIKFGLKPRKLNGLFASISYLRDFYTTCYYCLVSKA
jgi:SAM-dependent methyltransferase